MNEALRAAIEALHPVPEGTRVAAGGFYECKLEVLRLIAKHPPVPPPALPVAPVQSATLKCPACLKQIPYVEALSPASNAVSPVPPLGVELSDEQRFEAWWQEHGQFCRAGGGDYEKTFAFRAWEAALASSPAVPSA